MLSEGANRQLQSTLLHIDENDDFGLHLYEPRIFALDKGLFREGMLFSDTRTVKRSDFEEFGRRIGLAPRLVKRELDAFASEQPLVKNLINRSFLSEKLKRYYWQSFSYRRTTLQ